MSMVLDSRDVLTVGLDELKQTFLTSVSHALRTPLSSIIGYTLTLAREDVRFSPEEQREMLMRLERNARRLDALLADILELGHLTSPEGATLELRPTDVRALVQHSVCDTDLGMREVKVEAEPAVAAVDEEKVERMIRQLLLNAHRHTPPGGRIWVRLKRVGGGVQLAVDDEGPGVPDALKNAIFEPLRHGKELQPSPGLGIGLALVAGYADLHGGRAWVEDRPPRGASFRVFLPSDG